jgi:hypothetical protein
LVLPGFLLQTGYRKMAISLSLSRRGGFSIRALSIS